MYAHIHTNPKDKDFVWVVFSIVSSGARIHLAKKKKSKKEAPLETFVPLSREIPEIWEWVTVFTVHERSFHLENGRFVTLGRERERMSE